MLFPNPSFIRNFYIPNSLQMYTHHLSKSMKATDNLAFFLLAKTQFLKIVKKPPLIKPVREDEI